MTEWDSLSCSSPHLCLFTDKGLERQKLLVSLQSSAVQPNRATSVSVLDSIILLKSNYFIGELSGKSTGTTD